MRLVMFFCGVAYGIAAYQYIQPPTPQCQPIPTVSGVSAISEADRVDLFNLIGELK